MSSTDSSKTRRRWLRWLFISLAALAALYVGTAFVLSRFLDPEELAGWLEPRLETALNREVSVGGVEVGFFPLAVHLEAVEVSDPTGLARELARIGSVELRVKILPLLRREIQVSRLVVGGLRADLRVSEGGRSNFGDFSTRPPPGANPERAQEGGALPNEESGAGTGVEGPGNPDRFSLNLQSIRLESGQVRYGDESKSVGVDMEDLSLRAAARQDPGSGWVFVGSTGGSLTYRKGTETPLLEGAPLKIEFDVVTNETFEDLTIRSGEVRIESVALALEGRLEGLQDPVRSASLTFKGAGLSLSELLAVLPDSIRGRIPVQAVGLVRADLRMEGEIGPGHLPTVTGELALIQGEVTRDGKLIVQDLTAALDLTSEKSIQSRVQATFLGGPLSLEGTTTMGPGGTLDMIVHASPTLADLGSLATLPDGVRAEGDLTTEIRITGPLGDLRAARFSGNIRGTDVRAIHPALAVPMEIPAGDIQFQGVKGTMQDLPLILGEDRLSLTGEFTDVSSFLIPEEIPHFQGSLRGAHLDLTKLSPRPRPNPDLTYGRIAFAKVGDRPVGGGGFQDAAEAIGLARPETLPMGGSLLVALDTVMDNQGRVENVRAHVDFGPTFLVITDATFNRFGGEIRTALDLSLEPSEAAPFSFSLEARELDAGGFLSNNTPLEDAIRGTLSLSLDLVGTMDGFLLPDRPALVGSARFSLTNGGLNSTPLTQAVSTFLGMESLLGPPIQDWESSLVLEDGGVLLAEATIQGAPGSPEVGGRIGLNGELDLRSAFDLPTYRLSTEALDRLGVFGEIAADVAQRPEVVQAILRIGGSVHDPTVEADPEGAARTLGQAVEEEARAEAQERIDAEKARAEEAMEEQRIEAERIIQEQKDRLRNRATGLLQNLMRPRETALPDTLGQDTLQADTLQPDTLEPDTLPPDTLQPDTLRPDTLPPDTVVGGLGPSSPSGYPPPRRGKEPAPEQEHR